MAKMMILGMKGEDGLWLVDFDAGTATPIDGKREDYLAGAGTDGDADVSYVDVAHAFDTKDEAFGGFMYKTPTTDFAVAFDTKEEAFGGFMYKTPATDFTVAFDTKEEAFGGFLYKTPAADFAVAFDTTEQAFSGQYYKTPSQSAPDNRSSNH